MKKILILLLVALLTVSTGKSATLPDTTENIHLGLAFNRDVSEPSSLIGKVDYIWGATKNVAGVYMDAYLPYDRDLYTRTLDQWNAEHPDWVVYKCDKTTPAWEFNKIAVPLDITNPVVQDFQLQQFNRYLSGTRYPNISAYSGVGWDNVITGNSFGRCGIWRNVTWVPLYGGQGARDDPLFRAAVVDWAQTMYTKIKTQFPGKGVTMNLNYDTYATDLYPYLDMNLHEGGFTTFGNKLVADAKWLSTVQNFELLNSMNKAFFILNLYQAPDDASVTQSQVNWAIANYLMVKGSHSYMMIYSVYNSTYSYGSFYDRPEYHAQIGHPTSKRYAYQNVQRRDYSNGLVLVNPSSIKTYTVTLPAAYVDIYGKPVRSTVILAPTTAIILLKGGVRCANEGEFCGGIAGVKCCSGLKCQLEGNYPDAGGKCVKEMTKNCVDSDNGKDYYTKGTVTLGSESKTDSCTYCTGACLAIGCPKPICGGVVEYYCEGGQIKSEEYVCPNNCKDGACIKTCSSEGEFCGDIAGIACCAGLKCQGDGSCKAKTCSDGTLYNNCSSTKPKYCDTGNLIDKCSACDCVSGYECQRDDTCRRISKEVIICNVIDIKSAIIEFFNGQIPLNDIKQLLTKCVVYQQ